MWPGGRQVGGGLLTYGSLIIKGWLTHTKIIGGLGTQLLAWSNLLFVLH